MCCAFYLFLLQVHLRIITSYCVNNCKDTHNKKSAAKAALKNILADL